jgi:hypothetical protein
MSRWSKSRSSHQGPRCSLLPILGQADSNTPARDAQEPPSRGSWHTRSRDRYVKKDAHVKPTQAQALLTLHSSVGCCHLGQEEAAGEYGPSVRRGCLRAAVDDMRQRTRTSREFLGSRPPGSGSAVSGSGEAEARRLEVSPVISVCQPQQPILGSLHFHFLWLPTYRTATCLPLQHGPPAQGSSTRIGTRDWLRGASRQAAHKLEARHERQCKVTSHERDKDKASGHKPALASIEHPMAEV